MRHGSHVPGIFVEAPLNHCKICSAVSATAAMPLENKEGLIISDGNSRINNRGLVREDREGGCWGATQGTEDAKEAMVEESNGEEGRWGATSWQWRRKEGDGDVGGWFISAPQRSGSAYVLRASNYQLINSGVLSLSSYQTAPPSLPSFFLFLLCCFFAFVVFTLSACFSSPML